MSAEPRQSTTRHAWTKWENHVVDGRFPLRRCLGRSDRAAVFLTEHKAKNLAQTAIKFVRADAPQANSLLVRWQAAMALSHPHLIQLFEVGRWQSDGTDFLFVVMEYGDQTLAEILRRRALSAEEARELLPPVLDALTFLHRRQLVHGQLKPSNFLAVGDQLKLSSDTIRPASQDHGASTAGDVWSLGATLFEALTNRALSSGDHSFDTASLPAEVPASLLDTMRRCLSPTPADRPLVIDLRAEYKLIAPPPVPRVEADNSPTITPNPARKEGSAQSAPSPRREPTSSQVAADSSRATPPIQPTTTVATNRTSPHAGSNGPRGATPAPGPFESSQATAPLQRAHGTGRNDTSAQPAPSASREVTNALAESGSSQEVTKAQAGTESSREATKAQVGTESSREVTKAQVGTESSREAAKAQVGTESSREVTEAQAGAESSREATEARVQPGSSLEMVPSGGQRETIATKQEISNARETALAKPERGGSRAPATRETAADMSREWTPPQSEQSSARGNVPPQKATKGALGDVTTKPGESKGHPLPWVIGAAALLSVAIWGWSRLADNPTPTSKPAAVPAPALAPVETQAPAKITAAQPTLPVSSPAAQPDPASQASAPQVLHEVLPAVKEKILAGIQGRVHVTIRVLVDPSGNVIGALMEDPGPSKYFARLSEEAARQWQFMSAETEASRVWLLRFQFTRDGVTVRTMEQ